MKLKDEAQIWIYGYGSRGRQIAERLAQEGISICGFLDRNPERYTEALEQVRIIKPDGVRPGLNAVVICSVANVFAHAEIVELLAKRGFRYIIYKCFYNNQAAQKINDLYDCLTSIFENDSVGGHDIPEYVDIVTSEKKPRPDETGIVSVNIPAELLFGLTKEYLDKSLLSKDEYLLRTVPERSLLYYTPPQKMMQYFMETVDETAWDRSKALWFACRNAQSFTLSASKVYSREDQAKNLDERYEIFQKMDRLFCENPAFFKENPISVAWNKKGWFNIQDGNNRAAFLQAKGVCEIPAQMAASDYDAWMAVDEAVSQVNNALTVHLRSPLLHPKLKNVPSSLEYYSHKKTAAICDWLWKKQMDPANLHVCEYFCENDLCASHMARMGGRLTVIDEDGHLKLHKALDELYRLEGVRYCPQVQDAYQIILSNRPHALKELAECGMQAEWYLLEYVDMEDASIEEEADRFLLGKPEYLMRQLVRNSIYKVAAIKGSLQIKSQEGICRK